MLLCKRKQCNSYSSHIYDYIPFLPHFFHLLQIKDENLIKTHFHLIVQRNHIISTHTHTRAPHAQTFVDYLVNIGWEVIKFCKTFLRSLYFFFRIAALSHTKFLMWCNHHIPPSPFPKNRYVWVGVPLTSQILYFSILKCTCWYTKKFNLNWNDFSFFSIDYSRSAFIFHYLSSFYFYYYYVSVCVFQNTLTLHFLRDNIK